MTDLHPLAVGIGLVVSLIFTELFGMAAGGMVVPGYVALHLNEPGDVLLTLGVALATFAVVHAMATIVIVYGRRRTVLMILVGYLFGVLTRSLLAGPAHSLLSPDNNVIGFIIPGLIAIWMDRQGLVETIASLVTASVVVRLVLILLVGTELHA